MVLFPLINVAICFAGGYAVMLSYSKSHFQMQLLTPISNELQGALFRAILKLKF